MKIMIFVMGVSILFTEAIAQNVQVNSDSSVIEKKRSNLKLNTRLHSLGLFNFSGRICTDNPAFDFTLTYERKAWGIMTFTAIDIYDQHSDNNFSLTLLYAPIKIGNRIMLTPHTGIITEDWGREKGDRHILVSSVKANSRIHLDHTTLFANTLAKHDREWVNRVRMLYHADEHLDFIFSLWHNNKVFDAGEYFSTALNSSYNRIKISEHLLLNTGMTILVMANTNNEEMFPKKNGIVFTIGAVID
jgi:hypothetical protein